MPSAKRISLVYYTRAAKVAEFIRVHCCNANTEALSIAKLTKRFAMSETTLKSVFKQRYQINIHAFVIQARVEHICSLLEGTNHSIKTIAIMTGYSELSNFSRDFTRAKGMSPTVYRQEKRKGGYENSIYWNLSDGAIPGSLQ